MQGIWYGDRRDRVKWGALAFLAKEFDLASILQVAYFRESGQNLLRTHRGDVKIADAVWKRFANLSGVEGLSRALRVDIKVYGKTFDPSNREQYLNGVLESVAACRQPRLVFLDPDTGIEPGTLKAEHASAQELERLWDNLTPGEVLAVYQHASFSPDWITQSIKRMACACRGALVRAIQGNVARDVAILWARKGRHANGCAGPGLRKSDNIGGNQHGSSACQCCQKKLPFQRPRICPECGHRFKGNGWDGIDAHWRSKHKDVMPYERFWNSLCSQHKG